MFADDASFPERVYAIVASVPYGRVITYGAIAHLLGDPRKAREVGWAMAATPRESPPIPAHRVINARGELSAAKSFGGYWVLRKKLEAEGVVFMEDGRVDLEQYLWLPGPSGSDAPTGEEPRDGDQDDRTNDGDDERLDIEAVHHVAAKHRAGDPAADDRAQNAEHDVANDSVTAAA